MNDIGRIMARKPDVYDGETSIDDWVDSMRAYIKGTNPGVTTYKVRVSLIKLFMGPNALRMVKHILKEDYCDWVALKKCLESVFDRHTMKYSTLNAHFLLREQKSDESFASFFKDLWGLCDEMEAMKPIDDADKEDMVVGRFTEGIHNVIVRNSVKQYVNTHGLIDGFISRNVYDAAKFYARDTGVEEQYFKSYNETASLLKKRQDPDKRFSVSNINYAGNIEKKVPEKRYQDSGRSRSTTPERNKPATQTNNNQYRDPVTCYNCQQIGHVSKYCRNRKAQRPEYKQPTESAQPTNNRSRNSAKNTRNKSTTE